MKFSFFEEDLSNVLKYFLTRSKLRFFIFKNIEVYINYKMENIKQINDLTTKCLETEKEIKRMIKLKDDHQFTINKRMKKLQEELEFSKKESISYRENIQKLKNTLDNYKLDLKLLLDPKYSYFPPAKDLPPEYDDIHNINQLI